MMSLLIEPQKDSENLTIYDVRMPVLMKPLAVSQYQKSILQYVSTS